LDLLSIIYYLLSDVDSQLVPRDKSSLLYSMIPQLIFKTTILIVGFIISAFIVLSGLSWH